MKRRVTLRCGKDLLEITVPDTARILEGSQPPPLPDPEGSVRDALERPLAGPPLKVLARGKKSCCILVSDQTRPVPNRLLLPPLLERLAEAGIHRERILILVATGMHRACTDREHRELLGPETLSTVQVLDHDCQDGDHHAPVLHIDGHPMEIDTRYLDADLKILTGLIEPHPFAGFSGGGKSILPGISSFRTMQYMHAYALVAHPGVTLARRQGNPFQEAVREALGKAGGDFLVNVVLDKERRLAGVFAGSPVQAHDAGCDLAERHALATTPVPADLVVSTGGGYPLDTTFYQATKGLIGAKEVLAQGGRLLLVAGCGEGIGAKAFEDLLVPSPEAFAARFAPGREFAMDQWGAQKYYQVRSWAGEILAWAPGLTKDHAARLGIHLVEDLQETLDRLAAKAREVAVIPEGPYVVTRCGSVSGA